jgi:hypothetical protein
MVPLRWTTRTAWATDAGLDLEDALAVRAAEYWLLLGEADEAFRELVALSSASWSPP